MTWDNYDGKTVKVSIPLGNITYENIKATSFVKIEKLSTIINQNNYTHLHL